MKQEIFGLIYILGTEQDLRKVTMTVQQVASEFVFSVHAVLAHSSPEKLFLGFATEKCMFIVGDPALNYP